MTTRPETLAEIAFANRERYAYPSEGEYGLTKRELFAAMAMQAIITSNPGIDDLSAAYCAVMQADELLLKLADL